MKFTILIVACMFALAVSAPRSEEGSPFAHLTVDQCKCVIGKVQADPSILVSIFSASIGVVKVYDIEHSSIEVN